MAKDDTIERILRAIDELSDDKFTEFYDEMRQRGRAKKRSRLRGRYAFSAGSRRT